MADYRLGAMETRFAHLIWENAPVSSGELVKLCEKELSWKKSTTYTMLRKLGDRGLLRNQSATVTALVGREQVRQRESQAVLERMPGLERLPEDGGIAERYRQPGAAGTVGLIRPLSRCFCAQCNRIRLTADGRLKPCLHSREEIPVRGLHGEALRQQIERAIRHKPERHGALSAQLRSEAGRAMHQIGG